VYLDLSAKVSLDLLLPVPGELLPPFLSVQVPDGPKPLTTRVNISVVPRPRGIGTKILSKKKRERWVWA
jgi:hypothetical protein